MEKYLYFKQFIFIILFITFISKISPLYFAYPNAITLKNGNIFIVHQDGITICDDNLKEIIKNVTIFSSQKLNNEEDLCKVSIDQFDDGYIFCFVFNKIYIIDNDGELEFNETLISNNDIYSTLALEKVDNKTYYYLIGYISQSAMNLFYYIYDSSSRANQIYMQLLNFKRESYTIKNEGLTCQFLFMSNQNIVVCFYYTNLAGTNNYLGISYFTINNNTKSLNKYENFDKEIRKPITFIKSVVSSDHSKIFIGSYHTTDIITSLIYYFYKSVDIYSYYSYSGICNYNKYSSIKLTYSEEKDEFGFSCMTKEGKSIMVSTFDKETENSILYQRYINFTCDNFNQYSLLYLKAKKNYIILSDLICEQNYSSYIKLLIDINEEEREEEEEVKEEEEKEEEEEREEEVKKEEEKEREEEEEENEEEKEEEEDEKKADEKEEEMKERKEEEFVKKEEKEEKEEIIYEKEILEEEEIINCIELEKCELCNKESISKNLCIKCNNRKNYYYLNNNRIISSSIINEYIDCVDNKPSNYYFDEELKEYKQCYELCLTCDYGGDINENNCTSYKTDYINYSLKSDTNSKDFSNFFEIENIIYEKIKNILNGKIEKILEDLKDLISSGQINFQLDNIVNGDKDIIVNNKDTLIQISSTDNQKNNEDYNISSINLGDCETILKNKYNINQNTSLLILKVDSFIEGLKIPVIQYEVYHPINKSKLDLNLCDNSKIEINIPVSINETILYKYEPKSDYYNDRCFTYTSDNGTDIPLINRREEFKNNNMSLCEVDCEYLGYNNKTKKVKCECDVKKEISIINIKIDSKRLYDIFTGVTSSNIDIIKCYHLLFINKNLLNNIGFYIILIIIIFFVISVFIFIFKGYKLLKKKINFIVSIVNINKNRKNSCISLNSNLRSNALITSKHNNRNKKDNNKDKKRKKYKNNPPKKKEKKKRENKQNYIFNNSNSNEKYTSSRKMENNEDLIGNINIKNDKNKNEKKEKLTNKKKRKKSQLLDKTYLNKKISKSNIENHKFLDDYELNSLQYKDALQFDKRTYFQYYLSLLKIGNLFLFSFVPNNDYNSMILKMCIFFFSFGLYYTVNALFFTDSTMGKIYEDNGEYDFIYQIPKILYSNLICTVINIIIKYLSLSEKDIIKIKSIKKKEHINRKVKEIKKCLLIKFTLFYLVSFILLVIFWFYVSCFCAVYKNTQLYLIKDVSISFTLSLIYPFGYYLLPGILRMPSLRNKNKKFLYTLSLLLQSI